jgi:hypothetical protein
MTDARHGSSTQLVVVMGFMVMAEFIELAPSRVAQMAAHVQP